MITDGFYSIVRYTPDPVRGEARNVALMLVDEERDRARMRVAPLSQVAPRLSEHGLLDGLLIGLATRLRAGELRNQNQVAALQRAIGPTLSLTPALSAAVSDDLDASLKVLYQTLVAPRRGRDAWVSHGQLLDRLVKACRQAGAMISPGTRVDDILFDAVVTGPERNTPIQVLSFDTDSESPRGLEHAAGHFLFGLGRVHADGVCVMQPPLDRASAPAKASHRKVSRWMADAGVEIVQPDDMARMASSMAGMDPLPLVMST